MTTITDLQIAVLNDNLTEAQSVITHLDRSTEAEIFQKAAEHFGFKTIEHQGRRYAMRNAIATIFGYANESGLRMLCDRYNIEAIPLSRFAQAVRIEIADDLKLSPKDNKTTFIGWEAFLLAAIESSTPKARAVHGYLLKMERAARIAAGAVDLTNPAKTKLTQLAESEKVINMICKVDRIADTVLRQRAAENLDDVLEGALGVTKQPDLFFIAQPE
ncbi:MAG: hypothetical protein P1U50_10950 [Parvibaculaceae bacterium]|nr:hypothetical protein [Parvibaculaceae bacterium]